MLELNSEGRSVKLLINPVNKNPVIVVNDNQVELTVSELTQIAATVLGPATTQQEMKKGK